MSEANRDPELNVLEAALTQLAPLQPALSRDRLLFQAGQRAGSRPGRFWPAISAALALLSVVLGSALLVRPEPPTRERVVYVQVPGLAPPVPPVTVPAPSAPEPVPVASTAEDRPILRDSFQLRRKVMEQGVDALPTVSWSAPAAPRESLPDLPRGVLSESRLPSPTQPLKSGGSL